MGQSPHQLIYNLYNVIALTEIKGYAMIQARIFPSLFPFVQVLTTGRKPSSLSLSFAVLVHDAEALQPRQLHPGVRARPAELRVAGPGQAAGREGDSAQHEPGLLAMRRTAAAGGQDLRQDHGTAAGVCGWGRKERRERKERENGICGESKGKSKSEERYDFLS